MCLALDRVEHLQKVCKKHTGSFKSSSSRKSNGGNRRGKEWHRTDGPGAAAASDDTVCGGLGGELKQHFMDALEHAWQLKRQLTDSWPLTGVDRGLERVQIPQEVVSGLYRGLGGLVRSDWRQLQGLVSYLAQMQEQAAVEDAADEF
jgi:hypothetical protein